MAYTTIKKSTNYFDTKLYTGTGSNITVSDIPFNPDFVWFKKRDGSSASELYDQTRGATKYLISNSNDAEDTNVNGLTAFGTGGWTIGGNGLAHSGTMVAWNWKANGAGSANTDGSINTTATSVNTSAGISICKWTGTAANATIGHGLGATPGLIFIKNCTAASRNWVVYHKSLGNGAYMHLDLNNASSSSGASSYFNSTSPTNSVFSIGADTDVNGSGDTMIAYCFADTVGFSKFSSFTGNGNLDGPFCYTGFKPAFVIIKNTITSSDWNIYDNRRSTSGGYNVVDYTIVANSNAAEDTATTYNDIDILSNGFKIREDNGDCNGTGQKMAYIAFAAEPLVGDNPATAR